MKNTPQVRAALPDGKRMQPTKVVFVRRVDEPGSVPELAGSQLPLVTAPDTLRPWSLRGNGKLTWWPGLVQSAVQIQQGRAYWAQFISVTA